MNRFSIPKIQKFRFIFSQIKNNIIANWHEIGMMLYWESARTVATGAETGAEMVKRPGYGFGSEARC
jgi:hypothetical protein